MSLSDKILLPKFEGMAPKVKVQDLKQTIQDFTKELKEEKEKCPCGDGKGRWILACKECCEPENFPIKLNDRIDELNQKHYGDKLIKEKLKSSSLGKPIGVGVDSNESSAPALKREIKGEKRKWKK